MEYLFLYLLQLSHAINGLGLICLILGAIYACVWVVYVLPTKFCNEETDRLKPLIIRYITKPMKTLLTVGFVLLFIPSQQTLVLMGATYYGKKAVTAMSDSKKLEKINTIIDLKLDAYIQELQQKINNPQNK
jgi:hypothetical protein